MTIGTLIQKVYEEKPNSFHDEKLVEYINEIEVEVAEQLGRPFEGYDITDPEYREEELMVPAPYDRLYVSYVKSQIDYANEEYPSYQVHANQHVQDFADFVNWVVREGKMRRTGKNKWPSRYKNAM